MASFKFGCVCLVFLILSKTADCDIGTACPNGNECGTGETCNATPECECDTGNLYAPGPVQTTKCFLAVDLAAACTTAGENDECLLGNGQTGTICTGGTPACECDTGSNYVEDGSTCKKDCLSPTDPTGYTLTASSGTLEGASATVACAIGYSEDSGTPAPVTCPAGGTWPTPTGCTIEDCGEPPVVAGYTATKDGGTTYGETASVVCDGNGWTGTATGISCAAGGTWTVSSGCSQSGGGDCGSPTNPTGYTLTASGGTMDGASATVACASGYSEDSGTPSAVTCSGGTWGSPTGCSAVDCGALTDPTNGAVDTSSGTTFGNQATYSCDSGYSLSGSAQVQCQAGGTWEAAPTCQIAGAGDIKQKLSFVILIGALVLALM